MVVTPCYLCCIVIYSYIYGRILPLSEIFNSIVHIKRIGTFKIMILSIF